MKQAFLRYLVDPDRLKPLEVHKATLKAVDGAVFEIREGVPILLSSQKARSKAAVHRDFKSDFNYQEHYEEDGNFFDYFEEYNSAITRFELRQLHKALLIELPKNCEEVLDVGCGNGWVARHLQSKGIPCLSMDIGTANPIRLQQEIDSPLHQGIVADVFKLPFKDESFSAIIASEIMEHVPDPQAFVSALYSRLKKGGRLIISTPYNEKIEYNLCVHCNKPTPKHAHLHSFNESNISALIPRAARLKSYSMANKYLLKLRLHPLFTLMPYPLWRAIDKLASTFSSVDLRLVIVLEKPSA